MLIGADGVHSAVRRLIDPKAPAPTYVGLINLGGYARGVQVDAEPGSYTLIFGKRAFFGYLQAPDGVVWWFTSPSVAVEHADMHGDRGGQGPSLMRPSSERLTLP